MAENSKIGWTDHTQNWWVGCDRVSAECRFCYIEGIMKRAGREPFNGPMKTKTWGQPLRWQRQALEKERHLGSYQWIITGCEQAGIGKRREMEIEWVRDIDKQCRQSKVAHFFKQRYVGTQLTDDGMLDGRKRQAWPVLA